MLGSHWNIREVVQLLALIERVHWNDVPEDRTKMRCHRVDYSPGRAGPGCDFFYYNPYTRAILSASESYLGAPGGRRRPVGRPTGYLIIDSWSGAEASAFSAVQAPLLEMEYP